MNHREEGYTELTGRSKLETGHGVGVYVLAIPKGEAAVRTLHLEPELLVEGDAGGVSKYENAASSLPCSYRRRRRRAVGISESVESAEDAFAPCRIRGYVSSKRQTGLDWRSAPCSPRAAMNG